MQRGDIKFGTLRMGGLPPSSIRYTKFLIDKCFIKLSGKES